MEKLIYGYLRRQGRIIVHEEEARKVRALFEGFCEGKTIREAGLGIPRGMSALGQMLSNRSYLGERGYPPLIEKELFEKAAQEKVRRNTQRKAVPRGPSKTARKPEESFCLKELPALPAPGRGEEPPSARSLIEALYAKIREGGEKRLGWADQSRYRTWLSQAEELYGSETEGREEHGESKSADH